MLKYISLIVTLFCSMTLYGQASASDTNPPYRLVMIQADRFGGSMLRDIDVVFGLKNQDTLKICVPSKYDIQVVFRGSSALTQVYSIAITKDEHDDDIATMLIIEKPVDCIGCEKALVMDAEHGNGCDLLHGIYANQWICVATNVPNLKAYFFPSPKSGNPVLVFVER